MCCQCTSVRLIPRGINLYCSNWLLIIVTILAKLTMLTVGIFSANTFFDFNSSSQDLTSLIANLFEEDDPEVVERDHRRVMTTATLLFNGDESWAEGVELVVFWWIGVFLLPFILLSLLQNCCNPCIFLTNPCFLLIGVVSHFQIGQSKCSNGDGPVR